MLVFENGTQVDEWSARHEIPKGDMKPIENIWSFSKKWYGKHVNADWTKWSTEDARKMFAEFGLTGHVWELGESTGRF